MREIKKIQKKCVHPNGTSKCSCCNNTASNVTHRLVMSFFVRRYFSIFIVQLPSLYKQRRKQSRKKYETDKLIRRISFRGCLHTIVHSNEKKCLYMAIQLVSKNITILLNIQNNHNHSDSCFSVVFYIYIAMISSAKKMRPLT